MPVRMYALAKELKLDSKVLVDICAKAGVPGKGSALASLDDDEVTKVRDYISGKNKPARKPARAAPTSAPPIIEARPTKPAAPVTPVAPAVVRREDYIAPVGGGSKMPVLDVRSRKPAAKVRESDQTTGQPGAGGAPKRPQRTGPVISLAPLPTTEQPKPKPKSDEPAPQKPEIRLPMDAIQSAKAGGRPLAAHLKKVEKQSEVEAKKAGKGPAGPGRRGPSEPAPASTKGRRGKAAPREEGEPTKDGGKKPLLGGREARQLNRKRSGNAPRGDDDSRRRGSSRRLPRTRRRSSGVSTAAPRKGNIVVTVPCTVRSFSEAIGVPAAHILRILVGEGVMTTTITAQLEPEMAEFIAAELGVEVEFKQQVSLEDQLITQIREHQDNPEDLVARPPVITFLGHVDHGKTSLLDRIIGIDVVSGESGGITQHIRAYELNKNGHQISFVDTPGHEAFTEMRARGANVTDIAVLVVAADDGIMPQTEEAISHAKAAEVPIVVALNKMDLPGIDENRAMQGLSTAGLLPSEWGGDTEVVKTSAVTGDGIDELLDTLLTVAELHEYRANPKRPAYGTCLEAQQESGRGIVAKILVQNGTLRVGDILVCGAAYGRVKAMYDTLKPRRKLKEAGPSMPVNLTGLNIAPEAGEHFYVLDNIVKAREIAEQRASDRRTSSLVVSQPHVTLETLFDRLGGEGEVSTLNMILRADVRGSIEAIQKELTKLEHDEVKIKILQATVGGITEADVHLADASDAIIIGFNVVPDEGARQLADRKGVQVRRYDIIYKVTEDLRAALEGMLKPEEKEVELGRALVQRTFSISRLGMIAGCRVLAGTIERNNARVRIIRNNTIIGDYPLGSLRRDKDDVREAREGLECGIRLDGFNDIKEADIFEVYRIVEVGRKLDE